jgi:hypothetical protein
MHRLSRSQAGSSFMPQDASQTLSRRVVPPVAIPLPRRGRSRFPRHPEPIFGERAVHASVVLDCFEALPANPRTNRTSGTNFPVDEARHKQTKLGLAQPRPARSTAHQRVANLNARDFQQPHLICKLLMFTHDYPKAATGDRQLLAACRQSRSFGWC